MSQRKLEKMAFVCHASVIGSLMYAMMYIRLDICYVIGLISKFQSNLGLVHWKEVKSILSILRELYVVFGCEMSYE